MGFASFVIAISVVIVAVFDAALTAVVMETVARRRNAETMMEVAVGYMHDHGISPELSVKVKQHIRWRNSVQSHTEDDAKFLAFFPPEIRRALIIETREDFLGIHAAFRSMKLAHPRCYE